MDGTYVCGKRFVTAIKNMCPRKKLITGQKNLFQLQTEVCKVPKQQPNFVKFCIIIHSLMCNSHTKFGLCSFYSRVVTIDQT